MVHESFNDDIREVTLFFFLRDAKKHRLMQRAAISLYGPLTDGLKLPQILREAGPNPGTWLSTIVK